MNPTRRALMGALAVLALLDPALAQQPPIKIAGIFELSGVGATAGTNMKNGVELAVKEINAAGGILGHPLQYASFDTQSNPGVAKGLTQKAADEESFAIFGPVFSGSIMVSMAESQRAGIPNFIGGEAASITQQGNPYIFRTSFTQASAMPKIARYAQGQLGIQSIAVIFVNNDFGKGGRDAFRAAAQAAGLDVVADISTDSAQLDFSAAVMKAKQSKAEAVFVYLNEEESARALKELRKQGWKKPIIGETTLTGQKVIELAGPAANGAIAHVGLTVDAPNPRVQAFKEKFVSEYNYVPDHNGLKGYTGVYILKAAIEQVGKLDRQEVSKALHGIKLSAGQHPGILMDVGFDANGDLDRESFLVEVKDGQQVVSETLPALGLKP